MLFAFIGHYVYVNEMAIPRKGREGKKENELND